MVIKRNGNKGPVRISEQTTVRIVCSLAPLWATTGGPKDTAQDSEGSGISLIGGGFENWGQSEEVKTETESSNSFSNSKSTLEEELALYSEIEEGRMGANEWVTGIFFFNIRRNFQQLRELGHDHRKASGSRHMEEFLSPSPPLGTG